jgi:hypothetical protein
MLVFVSDAAAPRPISGSIAGSGVKFAVEVPPRRTVVSLYDRKGTLVAELNPSHTDAF